MESRSLFNLLLTSFFALIVALAVAPSCAGVDRYWTGAATSNNGNWSDSNNWSSGYPASGDDSVYFLSTGDYNPNPNNNFSDTFSLKKLTFNSGAASLTLTGSPITFNMAASGGGIYQNSANPVRINNALSWTGSNTLTLKSQVVGGLILAGSLSTSTSGSLVTIGGGSVTFSTGSFGTGTNGNLRVGDNAPASLTVQDNATLSVGGELNVNYQNTLGTPSTLTLKSGSLTVASSNQTIIGRANLRTGPSNTSAAFYQSGGVATLGGLLTVGYNGTAMSLLDINGGSLNANGGLIVGDGATSHAGNGSVNVHGAGVVNVTNGSGLVIGQDGSLTTSGKLTLSSGSLNVTGNLVLSNSGGIGTLTRSGGSLSVSGNLAIGGVATLNLDDTSVAVPTAFGETLTRTGNGTLVIVPQNGHLSGNERVTFGSAPSSSNGIIGPWLVAQVSGSDSSGTYLTYSSSSGQLLSPSYSNASGSHTTSANELLNITGSATITDNGNHAWILRVGPYTATLANTVTLGSGGLILNGGSATSGKVTGGTLALGGTQGLFYAGSSNPSVTGGTIESPISGSSGFLKFGPGTLVLAGNNANLSGAVTVDSGTLRLVQGSVLGGGVATVAGGAALELSSTTGISVGSGVTLAGSGVGGNGVLRNVAGGNSMGGTLTLASDAQINVDGGSLTLNGAVAGASFNLTKAGPGTLVLAGNSGSFPGTLAVAGGTLRLQHNNALGTGSPSVTVNGGTTVQIQGGISLPSGALLNLSGVGSGNGALENVQGNNTWAGSTTLAGDSTVGIDSAGDTLTISGPIDGDYALTKVGAGTLVLSSTGNSYTGALLALDGTLKLPSVNSVGSNGPLGAGLLPIGLGSSGKTANFWYTGSSASTDHGFTLAANGTGNFDVDSQSATLTLSGAIGGKGGLIKTGSGQLVLNGTNTYSGATSVASGTLAIGSAGSINGTSGIVVTRSSLQVTASGGNQLSDNGNITLTGGSITYAGNGATGAGENVGVLVFGSDDNSVTTTRQGGTSYTPYLSFAGLSYTPGSTVNFSSTDCEIRFRNSPPQVGGILGVRLLYNHADFAGCAAAAPYVLSACTSTTGDLAAMSGANVNAKPSGTQTSFSSQKEINSLNLTGSANVTMTGSGSLALDSGGLIANNSTSGTISGGTLKGASSGELFVNTLANLSISSVITNNGGATVLTKAGSGKLTLSGTNTYTGDTNIIGGTLAVGSAGAIPSGTGKGNVTLAGGTTAVTLDLAGIATVNVNGLCSVTGDVLPRIYNSVNGTTSTLVVGNNDATCTFAGSIQNNPGGGATGIVALTKSGGGTLTLCGSNTYTGGTVVQEGVLEVLGGSAIPDGTSLTIGSGCCLIFGGEMVQGSPLAGLSIEGDLSARVVANSRLTPGSLTGYSTLPNVQNSISVVPEPSTLVLLVVGLVGSAIISIQRFARSSERPIGG